MSTWRRCCLGDLIELKRGYDLPRDQRTPGLYPIVSSSGLSGTHNKSRVKGPGIVTGRYGTLGEVFYVTEDFWPLNTSLYVRDFKGNDPRFIKYLLSSLDLSSQNAAGAVPGLNRNHLHQIKITAPNVATQRRIASILSTYDDLIENNTRRIAILEEMTRRLYEEWFVKFRFPGYDKADFVSDLPPGWLRQTVNEVSSYINRGLAPKYDENADCRVINQKCIRDQHLSMEPARRQSKAVPPEKLIRFGDVLINSTGVGTLGRVAQIYETLEKVTADSHVTIVRPDTRVDIDYFGHTLLRLQPFFEDQGVGSTGQTELSRNRIGETELVTPPIDLQKKFGQIVRPMRLLCVRLAAQNANLRAQRDLLLPKLISGEIDVSGAQETVKEAVA